MKNGLLVVLLIASLAVGLGGMLWPAYEGIKVAFESSGKAPGEYAGVHECPPGQNPIEVVERFNETFGGTTSTGSRISLACEHTVTGARVDVSERELQDEVNDIGRSVAIGIAASVVGWILFSVFLAVGAKSLIFGQLIKVSRRPRVAGQSYSFTVPGAVTVNQMDAASLDPETREQVSSILKGIGLDIPLDATEQALDSGASYDTQPRRSVADRLRELSDLREAGLITREEYEEQREAIVHSLGEA